MSLTTQLHDPRSPISRFMAAQLPGDRMITDYQSATQRLPTSIKPTGDVRGYPWPILGTAVDTRIRLWFGAAEHPGTAQGVRILRTFAHAPDAAEAGLRLLDRMQHLAVQKRPLTDEEENTAARYAILAARFEAIYRASAADQGRRAMNYFTERPPHTGLDHPLTVMARDIHPQWVTDVRRQLDAARGPLQTLKGNGVVCAPNFAGSKDIGQAEGDFLAGGMLIDCKATINPRLQPAQARTWFHQIAGYLLLDYKDEYAITHVGIYLARQATLLTWSTRGFLQRMGARVPLTELRHHLKATLTAKESP